MTETLERQVIELVAAERLYVPVSSMDNKLKKRRPVLARAIVLPDGDYSGERVYARTETKNKMAARKMRDAVDIFKEKYPQYGTILEGIIAEEREKTETHLYFGMLEGKRLTADDYLGVMADLGFGEASAKSLYKELIETSRAISRKRSGERKILVGKDNSENAESADE